jgi:hypothetical protein
MLTCLATLFASLVREKQTGFDDSGGCAAWNYATKFVPGN